MFLFSSFCVYCSLLTFFIFLSPQWFLCGSQLGENEENLCFLCFLFLSIMLCDVLIILLIQVMDNRFQECCLLFNFIVPCVALCTLSSSSYDWFYSEDINKRRPQRNRVFGHFEKAFRIPVQDRSLNYKPTLKLVLVIITLGTFVALFLAPAVYNTELLSNSLSGYVVSAILSCFHFLLPVFSFSVWFSN